MRGRGIGSIALASTIALAGAHAANASCNAIPSFPPGPPFGNVFSASPPDNSVVTEGKFFGLGQFPYKAAVGRVDRFYVLAGKTKSIAVAGDGICVGKSGPPAAIPAISDADHMIGALYFRNGSSVLASVYASDTVCRGLTAAMGAAASAQVGVKILACGNDDVKVLKSASGQSAVVLPMRNPEELLGDHAENTNLSVRLLVAAIPTVDATKLAAMLTRVGTNSCATVCGDLLDALACVDDFYAQVVTTEGERATASLTGQWASDTIPCELQYPTGLAANDFKAQCFDAPDLDDKLAKCGKSRTKLSMWRDKCGGIHIPFDYKAIRETADGQVKRVVAGRSGVGVKTAGENPRIRIPGAEFVGSTPKDDLNDDDEEEENNDTVNWRNPWFELWPAAPEEVGLRGSVKEDESVVHIFPRLPVNVLCENFDACFSVDRDVSGSVEVCASDDYEKEDPFTCLPDIKNGRPPQYFACEGGDFDGRPCTRKKHCKEGTCSRQPRCRKAGSVWDPTVKLDEGTKCWNDGTCKDQQDPEKPETPQCGYLLFDFSARANATTGRFTLDGKIDGSATKNERGACPNGTPCSKGGAGKAPPCANNDLCAGYTLEAQQEVDDD